ncbi:hypothetical protein DCAR_0103500 [Daucus carota subsp. sativus]|uniref:FRIGIDA-like protein n=1 Tax=Daucus carota subsp. sativus TaxID=79200 RepID=A0AAF1AKZ4_DAUCS|nr:hypothetical protein DCAR_0103500 [Daucus carota subsp. sativus]
MEVSESRRARVEKAMHSLLVEWKNLEHADSSTQRWVQDCCADIQSRQERLNTVQESVTSSHRKLEEITKSVGERLEEVESRERGLKAMHEELESKMKELDSVKGDLESGLIDVEAREKRIEDQMKLIEGVFEKFCSERKEVERIKGWLEGRFEEVKLKEKGLAIKEKSIKNREIKLGKLMADYDLKMKNVEAKEKELEIKEKSIDDHKSKLDQVLHHYMGEMMNVMKKKEEVKNREDELDEMLVEIDLSKRNVIEMEKQVEFKEKIIQIHETNMNKAWAELEMKSKEASSVEYSIVKPEPWSDDGSYADIRFSVTMDGNSLLLYLINHKGDLDSMSDEVYEALGKSKEPGKLVLDALQGFYSKKEAEEFEEDVVCRSSSLLLEQLRRISPHIQSYHKRAALKLASQWKEKMKSSKEFIVFLQLLASYRLESSFHPEEFFSLFEVINQPTEISELFQLLNYMGKVNDLITSLIEKGRRLMAIRYIYGFKLVEKFPPVPILNDHISFSNLLAEKIQVQKSSDEPEGIAIGKQLASLRAVVKCIKDHQLEVEYPPESLLARIQQLKAKRADMPQNSGKKRRAAGPKAQTGGSNRKRRHEIWDEMPYEDKATIMFMQPDHYRVEAERMTAIHKQEGILKFAGMMAHKLKKHKEEDKD